MTSLDRAPDELLVRRTRAAILLAVGSILMFAAADAILDPRRLPALWSIKALQLALLGGLRLALTRPFGRRHAHWIAALGVSALYLTTGVSGGVSGDYRTARVLFTIMSFCTATLLPWGVGPQVLTSAVAAVAYVGNVYLVTGGFLAGLEYPAVAMLVGFVVATYVAWELQRTRSFSPRDEIG